MIFWVFLYNLRLPIAAFCLLGIALCVMAAARSQFSRDSSSSVGLIHVGVTLAILASVMWAIPAPDYDVKIVYKDREVEKRVPVPVYKGVKEVPSTYQTIFDKCINSANVRADGDLLKQCHQQAREASTPAPAVKVVYKPSPYKDLFDQCNDGWTGSISDMKDPQVTFKARQERMTFCQGYAAQGATIH